ncbi:hypothetical protein [Ruania zhangjianzhongii]|uniref:AbiTii domain-containing protein n=1 Tax=Ruania zhangjianzhongii TaxID=2603206 RepID=UPI0011CAD079|nr:hypothetical protein [Ruania zhangjianzhongii]
MSNYLARAIEGLSTPGVELPDALRGLYVVSRRLRADDLTAWLRAELDGYPDDRPAPPYRTAEQLPIELHFDGMMRTSDTMRVAGNDLPEGLGAALRERPMRQPVAELAALAASDREVGSDLPPTWVDLYRQHIETGSIPHIQMMVLNRARVLVPHTYLLGILDRVKSNALDLALDLEQVAVDAGDAGGPTINDEPTLAEVVTQHMTTLFAPSATIVLRGKCGHRIWRRRCRGPDSRRRPRGPAEGCRGTARPARTQRPPGCAAERRR